MEILRSVQQAGYVDCVCRWLWRRSDLWIAHGTLNVCNGFKVTYDVAGGPAIRTHGCGLYG
ncbi:hypothetical protein T265_16216, partial [Opisthorchis viverrini]